MTIDATTREALRLQLDAALRATDPDGVDDPGQKAVLDAARSHNVDTALPHAVRLLAQEAAAPPLTPRQLALAFHRGFCETLLRQLVALEMSTRTYAAPGNANAALRDACLDLQALVAGADDDAGLEQPFQDRLAEGTLRLNALLPAALAEQKGAPI